MEKRIQDQTHEISEPSLANRMLGSRAMNIVAGVASVGAFMIAGSKDTQPISGGPDIAAAVVCDPSNPNVPTGICTPPVKELLKSCPQKATNRAYNGAGSGVGLAVGYEEGSLTNYRVKTKIADIGKYCDKVMKRKWTVVELLRTGPTGSFKPNGASYTLNTNRPKKINTVLNAPVVCNETTAGSAVEAQITSTAKPRHHYKLRGKTTATWHTPAQPVC